MILAANLVIKVPGTKGSWEYGLTKQLNIPRPPQHLAPPTCSRRCCRTLNLFRVAAPDVQNNDGSVAASAQTCARMCTCALFHRLQPRRASAASDTLFISLALASVIAS